MKFDIDSRLEYAFNTIRDYNLLEDYDLSREEAVNIKEDIGTDAYNMFRDIILNNKRLAYKNIDKAKLSAIKQSYLTHKQTKNYSIANDSTPYVVWDSVVYAKNYVIQEVVDEKMFYSYDVDYNFLCEVCRYTTKQYEDINGNIVQFKGESYDEIRSEIKKVIQQYIKHGYNPYNLMNSALKQYNECKEKNRNETDKEVVKNNNVSMEQCLDVCTVLENCEKTFSPYKKVFETAEHLGELINKSKELQKTDKIEESLKVDEEIDEYKQKIAKTLSGCEFDLQELESIITGKSQYVKEREIGFNYLSANYDLYQGLLSMKKIVHFQAQKNLNVETTI